MPRKVRGSLCASCHFELGENRRDVVLDRLLGQLQLLADLPVRHPPRDKGENSLLLRGETRELLVAQRLALAQPLEDRLRHFRVEEALSRANLPDGAHQLAAADL